jgi:DNA-binding response OmpR family regulator
MDSGRGRVLVVDDDPKFAGIVVRCLDRAGYECVVADSGDQALLAVLEHHPDAIVLDVMMPPPDGIEVCRQLRADGWTGGIVMVSARSNPADHDVAVRVGADEFLGKPFPLVELVSAIDNLVGPERSRQ